MVEFRCHDPYSVHSSLYNTVYETPDTSTEEEAFVQTTIEYATRETGEISLPSPFKHMFAEIHSNGYTYFGSVTFIYHNQKHRPIHDLKRIARTTGGEAMADSILYFLYNKSLNQIHKFPTHKLEFAKHHMSLYYGSHGMVERDMDNPEDFFSFMVKTFDLAENIVNNYAKTRESPLELSIFFIPEP